MTQAGIYCGSAMEYYFDERCHITEWWNSADDADVSVARARVEPGVTTRLHRISNTTERYLILEGQGRVEIGDLAPTAVGPGDVVVIPPGVSQRIANSGDGDLVFLAICTPRFIPEVYEDIDTDGMEEVPLR
jgi:mannose-6-phosphate isomerase-like protein (cupin superfamily)